jgi:hypothetical protein
LNSLLPVLSKDTDWLGSVEAGMKLANRLKANWKQNPRKGEDFKQFTVMGFVVRQVLRELVARADAERALLKACNRLADFWLSTDGVMLVRAGITNPRQVLPSVELERHSGTSVQNFITKGLPKFERQLAVCLDTMDERALEKLRMEIKASGTDERT